MPAAPECRTFVIATLGLLGFLLTMRWLARKRKKLVWERVGVVERLFIYPMKSASIHEHSALTFGALGATSPDGIFRDRTFIAVDAETRRYADVRKHHKIVTVIISHDSDTGRYSLSQAEHGKVDIGRPEEWEPADAVGLWDVTVGGDLVDCGSEAARMLSRVLLHAEEGVRLVHHKSSSQPGRPPRPKWANIYPKTFGKKTPPAFGDTTPYMVMTSSSVSELKRRMNVEDFDVKHFRPNVVVKADSEAPFQEDGWLGMIRFGEDVTLSWAKFCDRCSFTTINPVTGHLTPGGEPLKTLRTFRQMKHINHENSALLQKKVGDRPILGNNYVLESGGEVRIGDYVYVGKYA